MTSVRKVNQMLASGLDALTTGIVGGRERVEAEQYPLASTEMAQRIHVPVTGVAGRASASVDIEIVWPYPIINQLAAGQHESTQEQPHIATGVELLSDEDILLDAQVRSWEQDERDFYIGASLRVKAWAPEAIRTVRFSAVIHVMVMGFAAASEDDTETTTTWDVG